MPDRAAVLAALAEHANKPATAHDVRAEPADAFGQPPFVALNQYLRTLGSLAELNELIAGVAPLIRAADPFRGGTVAINCGTFVEAGGDPDLVFPHLLAELPRHLALARRARERGEIAPGALFDADPDAARAAAGLMYFLLATMTVICRKASYRQALRANPEIVAGVEALRDGSAEADFVAQVLALTDDLELLVLAPNERKGFRVRLEAVASNAHMFSLLQAELIGGGHLAGEPLDEEVVAVARGESAPTQLLFDEARFHYYHWFGLNPDGTFMESAVPRWPPADPCWPGVGQCPADIARLDGMPILLIGPKVFGFRKWDNNFFANIHDALKSRAEIVEVLPAERVAAWLDRIKQAPR